MVARLHGLEALPHPHHRRPGRYERQLDHDAALGEYLREHLVAEGWEPIYEPPLPVVCFVDPAHPTDLAHHQAIVDRVLDTGRAWISTTLVDLLRSARP